MNNKLELPYAWDYISLQWGSSTSIPTCNQQGVGLGVGIS